MVTSNQVTSKKLRSKNKVIVKQINNKDIKGLTGKQLTLKQLTWLQYYINPQNPQTFGNATQSAIKAYSCTDETARVIGSENIAKLNTRSIMEQMGLSLPYLMGKTLEGLQATKLYTTKDEAIEHADYPARHKYLETSYKLMKLLSNDHLTQNNFQFSFGDDEEQGNG